MSNSDVQETLEERLDHWALDHLEAAIELRRIVRQAVLVDHLGGWRLLGKAVANLEVPEAGSGSRSPRTIVSRRSQRVASEEAVHHD
jgi:hypothetical protein